jgi:predicted aldo/keto reductase-like oxidoreductase
MTLAKAHELGMGIVAMKVMGATIFGHNAARMAPDFDKEKLPLLPGAAIRWVLADERIHVLNIGACLRSDIEQNVRTVREKSKLTPADRDLLADFSRAVYESEGAKKMRVV